MPTLENEQLVSKNARDRFLRWQEDLERADGKSSLSKSGAAPPVNSPGCVPCQYDTATPLDVHHAFPRDHTAAIMAGTWNEGQPDSPYHGTPNIDTGLAVESPNSSSPYFRSGTLTTTGVTVNRTSGRVAGEKSPLGSVNQSGSRASSKSSHAKSQREQTDYPTPSTTRNGLTSRGNTPSAKDEAAQSYRDALMVAEGKRRKPSEAIHGGATPLGRLAASSPRGIKRPEVEMNESSEHDRNPKKNPFRGGADGVDSITDTIGAIAVDDRGHIAAGSSSGGIGMKHRGRLGPAALVGIGTAVVPCSEDDEEGLTVAAVTSGTGEHMATTMASQRCAERIYHGTRKGVGGGEIQDDDEDAIIESFIANDFMNHPGVQKCHSAGAIGVMAVKKTRTGYYLFFAHNTDSFALASMGGLEKEPLCTMSRLSKDAKIAKGGRKIRIE